MAEKKRVCLIDDEKNITELAGAIIGFQGVEVEKVNDPAKAYDTLLAGRFDAVVIDIMMPGFSGLKIMERLRASPEYKDTPIVALSAKRLTDEERKFLHESGIHFIQKPFSPRRLVDIVRECLAG